MNKYRQSPIELVVRACLRDHDEAKDSKKGVKKKDDKEPTIEDENEE